MIAAAAVGALYEATGDVAGARGQRLVAEISDTGDWLAQPPEGLVPEADLRRLLLAVRVVAGDRTEMVLRRAGHSTADSLLAILLPPLAERLARMMPGRRGEVLLRHLIRRRTPLVAGSGRVRFAGSVLEIERNPLAESGAGDAGASCSFQAALFARLYDRLVGRGLDVVETACARHEGGTCRFELRRR